MFIYGFEISEHPELNADILDNMTIEEKKNLVAGGCDSKYTLNGFFHELNQDWIDTENYFYIYL